MITKLFCVARVLVVISLVFGADVLALTINVRGENGETACSLMDSLNQASCSGTSTNAVRRRQDPSFDNVSRRADEFSPTPSTCTCTTPFFNIWSVCNLFENRSNQLPLLKDWTTHCQNAGVSFRDSSQLQHEFLGNTKLPQWSRVPVLGDQVFDIVGVVSAALPTRWTPLQITAPIASAVSVACILGLIYLVKSFSPRQKRYMGTPFNDSIRRSSTASTEKEKRSMLERIQSGMSALRVERVKSEEPKGDWVIDSNDPEAQLSRAANGIGGGGAATNRLSAASTESTTTQATTNLSWGPLGVTSSQLDQFPAPPTFTDPFQPRPNTPQQHNRTHSSQHQHQLLVEEDDDDEANDDYRESGYLDPFSTSTTSPQPPLTSKWSESGHATPPLGKSGSIVHPRWAPPKAKWNVFKGLPFTNPLKRKPVRVKAVQPKPGFRLDDYDGNTESMLSRVASKDSGVRSGGDEDSVLGGPRNSATMDEALGGIGNFSGPSHSAQESRGGGAGDDEERLTLISGEERKQNHVFLISKNGREDFSISGVTMSESGTNLSSTFSIGVESPTASTVSSSKPLSAGGIRGNSETTNVQMAVIPPPPRLPPPTSPPKPIEPLRRRYPLANLPEEPVLPVIHERSGSESAASSTRWEPIAIDQSSGPAAPPNFLLPPLKSVYEAERYPSSVESLTSSASGSGSSSRAYGSSSSTSSAGTKPPRSLPQPQQHFKAQSLSAVIPPATPIPTAVTTYQQLSPPHTPLPLPHRRGLFEDDSTSFYQQAPAESSHVNLGATSPLSSLASLGLTSSGTIQTHLRTGSLENSNRRSNPQNLFPPSVRAAGYSGGMGMVSSVPKAQQR